MNGTSSHFVIIICIEETLALFYFDYLAREILIDVTADSASCPVIVVKFG